MQEQSTTPLAVANTTTTKSVIAKRTLTIRDIQRAERERLAKLAEEQAAQQEAMQQQSSEQAQAVRQMAAERAAEAQRQAALLAQQQEMCIRDRYEINRVDSYQACSASNDRQYL